MTDKVPFDFDAAIAALRTDERSAQPAISERLRARVLGDAAEISAVVVPPPIAMPRRTARSGGFRFFGLFDAWSGAAVAALGLCLGVGLGIGYGSGPDLMARMGLSDVEIAAAPEETDGLFLSEDVL